MYILRAHCYFARMFFGAPEACIIGKRLPVDSFLFELESFNDYALTPQSSKSCVSSLVSLFIN